jgi:sugar phosphate isomerase/epimerase
MQRVLSTYRYVKQPLSAPLLKEIAKAGVTSIELYCSPSHFSYASQQAVRDLAGLLRECGLEVHSLHSPLERDFAPGRESGVPISISDPERIRRLDAMDEVKRALEIAERIPFRCLVQHMGHARQSADPRKLDAAFNSLEHLSIFAKARGVAIALENTADELGAPATIQQFIRETHLHDLRVCFDVGHAQLEGGIAAGFELIRDRVAMAHVHDNHGEKDEHLLPHEGSIDWDTALAALASAPDAPALVLEPKEQGAATPSLEQVRAAFEKLEKEFESHRSAAQK